MVICVDSAEAIGIVVVALLLLGVRRVQVARAWKLVDDVERDGRDE